MTEYESSSHLVNDLARDINSHCGVKVGIDEANILNADDIVLLSEFPEKNFWIVWCTKWQIYINADKSKVIWRKSCRIT